MVDSSFTNPEAAKPCSSEHPCYVHASLHGQLLFRAEAMFHLQFDICRSGFPYML